MLLGSLMFMMWRRDLGTDNETDRVDPRIIRGLVLAPRVNFPGIKVARIHHVTVSR